MHEDQIVVSADGKTVWVHSMDGSTVGRFSTVFGMDVHTTCTQQMEGQSQCLHCTHTKPGRDDWLKFCELIALHHHIKVEPTLLKIGGDDNE